MWGQAQGQRCQTGKAGKWPFLMESLQRKVPEEKPESDATLLQQQGVEERPAVGKVCPLPCSLVPKPRLGWRGPVLLHDSAVSALRKKLLLLGLHICQVEIRIMFGLYGNPGMSKGLRKFRSQGCGLQAQG